MPHGQTALGGPLWFLAQLIVVLAIAASLYLLLDPLSAKRRARAAEDGTGPLWVYQLLGAAFLLFLIAIQLVPGVQLGAAAVAISAPLMLAVALVYLLRVAFPKRRVEE